MRNKKELQARKLEAPFLYQISAIQHSPNATRSARTKQHTSEITQLRRHNRSDHPDRQGSHLD